MKPADALELLTKFEFTMKKANLDHENLIKAKDAWVWSTLWKATPLLSA
jgi:hypothetical protein